MDTNDVKKANISIWAGEFKGGRNVKVSSLPPQDLGTVVPHDQTMRDSFDSAV